MTLARPPLQPKSSEPRREPDPLLLREQVGDRPQDLTNFLQNAGAMIFLATKLEGRHVSSIPGPQSAERASSRTDSAARRQPPASLWRQRINSDTLARAV